MYVHPLVTWDLWRSEECVRVPEAGVGRVAVRAALWVLGTISEPSVRAVSWKSRGYLDR